MEYISRYKPEDSVFGIADVDSSNSCRLTVGYFLGQSALSLILPKCCQGCQRALFCTREFGDQIIQKYNNRHRGQEIYFVF